MYPVIRLKAAMSTNSIRKMANVIVVLAIHQSISDLAHVVVTDVGTWALFFDIAYHDHFAAGWKIYKCRTV